MKNTSNVQMLKTLSKPWASNADVRVLIGCSASKASEIMREVKQSILKEGKRLPIGNTYVPMSRLVKHLGIDEKRIEKYAKIEMELLEKSPAATSDS